jgi:CRISPR/Cas system-associated exonuclease Cas4 (RecB family)
MESMGVLRNELKYYISVPQYQLLATALRSSLKPDAYSQEGGYFIRSLYFDTLEDEAYYDKVYGVAKRRKFRLRIYNIKDKLVKFEIKNKVKDKIFKETAIIGRDDAKQILKGNYEVLLKYSNNVARKIYCYFKKQKMRPVVLMDYLREAFVYDLNSIRITFDRNLRRDQRNFDFFGSPISLRPAMRNDRVILEVKYNHFLPDWIREMLTLTGSTRSAIGKYCIAREGGIA